MISSRAHEGLKAYLRGALVFEHGGEGGDGCSAVTLKQVGAEGANLLKRWPVDDPVAWGDPEIQSRLILEAVEMAQAECNELGGTQRYYLEAEYGRAGVVAERSPVFAVRSEMHDVEGTDPPTQKGITAMLMRGLNDSQRIIQMMSGQVMARMIELNEQLLDQQKNWHDERQRFYELNEELADRASQRRLEKAKAEAQQGAINEVIASVKPLIPTVLNAVAGKRLLPAADPQILALREVLSGFPPGTLTAFVASLPPGQGAAMLELLKGIQFGTVDPQALRDAVDVLISEHEQRRAITDTERPAGPTEH